VSGLLLTMAGVVAGARPLLFDIDQGARTGSCNDFAPASCMATSSSATTTVSGGLEPYTFLWTFVSGDSFSINTPTASNTTFSKTNTTSGSPSFNGIYKCVVTDDNGQTAEDTVSVTLNFNDLT